MKKLFPCFLIGHENISEGKKKKVERHKNRVIIIKCLKNGEKRKK